MQITRVKNFQLRLHTAVSNDLGHDAHIARRVNNHISAAVHGVQVQRANVGFDDGDVLHPFFWRNQGGARRVNFGVIGIWHKPATWPRSQVDDERFVALANAVYHIAVVLKFHGGAASGGVAHMNVNCSGTRFCRGQTLIGNLLRRHRQVRCLLWFGNVARDGASDESWLIKHLQTPSAINHKARAGGKAQGGGAGLNGRGGVVDMANAFEGNGGGSFLVEVCATARYER